MTKAGASAEQVFLPSRNIEHCRQCNDSGWGLCGKAGRCVIDDDLSGLVEKLRQADAVVMATPVYYGDLSESLRAFTDRLRRICAHEAGRLAIRGKPEVGVCVAGGGGVGAPTCCVRKYRKYRDIIPISSCISGAYIYPHTSRATPPDEPLP